MTFDETLKKDSAMASGHRCNFSRSESFFQSGVLSADDAADFARAFIFNLFERRNRNRARRFAFVSKIYVACGLGINRLVRRGFSGEYLYGVESVAFSRNQYDRALHKIAFANRFNRLGFLVHARKKKS